MTRRGLATVAALAVVAACEPRRAGAEKLPAAPAVARLVRVVGGLDQPVAMAAPAGDPRLFVAEKTGRIRVVKGGALVAEPFLDLSRSVSRSSEQGLLGLAFHPKDARRFVVNYTDLKGDTRVVEYRVPEATPDRADAATARELLFLDQPYANHNGGDVRFGPDGLLYIPTGDGGSGGDPKGNGQNRTSRFAKLLRLDVDAATPTPEIVAIGLRNPWRIDFDAKTGDFYAGDVGQNQWEEVDVVPFASLPGRNFGWNIMEGAHCYKDKGCDRTGLTLPVAEYDHGDGCSITGGVVYRGKAIPALDGVYLYADYCTALLRGFRWKDGAVTEHQNWKPVLDPDSRLAKVTSFGTDGAGEVYVLSQEGVIWKIVGR